MALDRNVGPEWSTPITLGENTIFQVQAGAVYLDLGADAPDLDDALFLVQDPERPLRDSVIVPSGVTVRWRQAGGRRAKLYYASLG